MTLKLIETDDFATLLVVNNQLHQNLIKGKILSFTYCCELLWHRGQYDKL